MKENDEGGDQGLPVVILRSVMSYNGLRVHVQTHSRQWLVVCDTCMYIKNAWTC